MTSEEKSHPTNRTDDSNSATPVLQQTSQQISITPEQQPWITTKQQYIYNTFATILTFVCGMCVKLYDLIIILLSSTHSMLSMWIIYEFQQANKDIWFIISLTFMAFGQLSYSILFVMGFHNNLCHPFKSILLFLIVLPFSCLIPLIFYWLSLESNENSIIFKFLDKCFDFYNQFDVRIGLLQSPLLAWTQKNRIKHIGYLFQVVIESIPQLIIQATYIIMSYYISCKNCNQNLYTLVCLSIGIGIASIAVKFAMFAKGIDYRAYTFSLLSFMIDCCGTFVIFLWYVQMSFVAFVSFFVCL